MREIEVRKPAKHEPSAVRRLQYLGAGSELAVWLGESDQYGLTTALYTYSFVTGEIQMRLADEWFWSLDDRSADPLLSPDGRFCACVIIGAEWDEVCFWWLSDGDHRDEPFPSGQLSATGVLLFTPDGAELLAVRYTAATGAARFAREVARFPLAAYTRPPLRYEEQRNPFTGQPYQRPVYDERWDIGMDLPPGKRICSAAIAPDGRLLAFGDASGAVSVADLVSKEVVALFRRSWPAVVPARDRHATAVVLGTERVASLANGCLFTDPLGAGKAWRSGPALGTVYAVAFHPSGRFLCAVGADGQARYLDTSTGAVMRSFKWAKRPKPLYSVCFAPDGLTCAAGGQGGKVIVWDVDA